MIVAIVDIAFSGVGAQSTAANVDDLSVSAYRLSIDTSSQITGDKAVPATGTPVEGVTVVRFVNEGGFNTGGASKLKIFGVTIPDNIASVKGVIHFEYYNATWVPRYFISDGEAGSTSGSVLIDGSVAAVKLANDIAGDAMERKGSGGLTPKLEAFQPSLQKVADELGVKLDAAGAIIRSINGLLIKLESIDPSLQISANQLGMKIDPDGGLLKGPAGTAVKVDPVGELAVSSTGIKLGACVCLKAIQVNVPSADVLNLNSVPFELIPAPGAGKYIEVISGTVFVNFVSNLYATNTVLGVLSGSAVLFESDCLATNLGRIYKFDQVPLASITAYQISVNTAVSLYVDGGNPTAGNSPLVVNLLYRVVTV